MALEIPRFLQTRRYPAIELRRAFQGTPIQAGVLAAADLKVTQRAAGATMSVDAAAGDAWVRGSFTARQGMYHVYNDAVVNLAIAANASGNPRIDQIVVRAHDTINGGSSQDAATLEVVQGTPTAGATLDNRSGVVALPTSTLRIADVLVANGAASITNSNIRDRRPWALGARYRYERTAGTYLNNSTSAVAMDATNLYPRIECVGNPLVVSLRARWDSGNAPQTSEVRATVDGVNVSGSTLIVDANVSDGYRALEWEILPSAGSHKIGLYWLVAATGQVRQPGAYGTSAIPLQFLIEETLKPSASND